MPYHNAKKKIRPVVDMGEASSLYPYMLHNMISFKVWFSLLRIEQVGWGYHVKNSNIPF